MQTEYVDTKSQLADILTNGSFTLDEWNHLLRLLNILNFQIFSCSHFFLSEQIAARTVCYVEERAGKYLQRKFGRWRSRDLMNLGEGEAETYQFGVVQYDECKERFSARYERFQQPGAC